MTNRIQKPYLAHRENSWYLRTGMIHHFICKCGQTDQFWNLVSDEYHPSHRCSRCRNDYYLDSMMFLTNEKVTRWSIFYWKIETIKTADSWIVRTYDNIPLFDYELQKIRFRKVYICTSTLFFTGKSKLHIDYEMIIKKYVYNHAKKSSMIIELMSDDLDDALLVFVLSSPIDTIAWIESKEIEKLSTVERIELFSFFLEYDHLKEYDFFYWENFPMFREKSKEYPSVRGMLDFIFNHRTGRSIKKAYFESYKQSLETSSRYMYTADYVFARYIEDRNFLLVLINIDVEVKYLLFKYIPMIIVEYFLEFLKEHYTLRTITKLFSSFKSETFTDNFLIRDTIQMFRGRDATLIREHFRKVPMNFQSIHDEFIRIHTAHNVSRHGKMKFDYHQNDINAQIKRDTFEYRLPKTVIILQKWAQELDNCMFGYSRNIHLGDSLIYGVFKENVLTYAIEIKGQKIVQALGDHNVKIGIVDREEIDTWFRKIYIDRWIKSL